MKIRIRKAKKSWKVLLVLGGIGSVCLWVTLNKDKELLDVCQAHLNSEQVKSIVEARELELLKKLRAVDTKSQPRFTRSQRQEAIEELVELNKNNTNHLSAAQLSDLDLRKIDLSKANLRGANLSRANLYSATLKGADLSYATLYRVNVINANMKEVKAKNSDFKEAMFNNTNLTGSRFNGADMSDVFFFKTDMAGVKIKETTLHGANLVQVKNLSQQQLVEAKGNWQTTVPNTLKRPRSWV